MNQRSIFCVLLCLLCMALASNCFAIEVSTVAALKSAVQSANSGGDKNIVILPGNYSLNGEYLRISAGGTTISGKTANRAAVVLDGGYITTEIFQIVASNVTIRNLTLKRAVYHPIHVMPSGSDVLGTLIENVHILDPGQQAIKINQNSGKTHSVNYGTVRNSHIELSDAGRIKVWEINGSCYTGGVDAHHATGWVIADNLIEGFWCQGGLSEHGVHFWSDSEDTLVERNTIVNCDRGIGFGLGSSGHRGGIIRNNMIYHNTGHNYSDVGIGLENASSVEVYNNTIFHEHAYANGIEYRFAGTNGGLIKNNLTNKAIVSRNGGKADVSHNHTAAKSFWFINPTAGDLQLAGDVDKVIDSGTLLTGLHEDFDKDTRPLGRGIDIGADEIESHSGTAPVSSWLMMLLKK